MSKKFKFDADGLKKIIARITLIQEAIAYETWEEARRLVPVRTGDLKRSIGMEKVSVGGGFFKLLVQAGMNPSKGIHYSGWYHGMGIGGKAYYAIYVELGTRYMRSQPFLRPALMKQMGRMVKIA